MFRNKRGNKMTDEEKAEEYAENEQCAHCSNPQYCQGKDECYDFANVKSHFLAGLEKENAELDCQMKRNTFCYSCKNATERCYRNEIGCPCEKYKSYKDENAEMKAQIKLLTEKVGFWEEQTKLKEAQIEEYDRLNMFDIARTDELREKAQKQLNKAKVIIRKYYNYNHICGYSYEAIDKQAEQFLNEVEKPIESSVDHIIEQNEKEVGLNPDYFLGGW